MKVSVVNPIQSWQSEADSLQAIAKQKFSRTQKSGPVNQRVEIPVNLVEIIQCEVRRQVVPLLEKAKDITAKPEQPVKPKQFTEMNRAERFFHLIGSLERLHDESLVQDIVEVQAIRDNGIQVIVCQGLSDLGVSLIQGRSAYYSLSGQRAVLIDVSQCQQLAHQAGVWTDDAVKSTLLHEWGHALCHQKRISFCSQLKEEQTCWNFAFSYAKSRQELMRFERVASVCLQTYS